MERRRILAALLAGGAAAALLRSRGRKEAPRSGWPVNFAHRGASWRAPENTLEAFTLGVEEGAGGLETDAHMTRDGEIVLIHDDTVDRTTDGSGRVGEMSLAELRRLDAGYRFVAGGGYPYRGRGLRVPTLREVYERFPGAAVNIEIKEDLPGIQERLMGVIRDCGAEERTLVASFSHAAIREFRRVSGGEVFTAASRPEISAFYLLSKLRLEGLLPLPYEALQVPVEHRGLRVVTPRFVEAARSRGVSVDVWTINDPEEMRRLLGMGVDVIMTDRPGELSRVLAGRG